MNNNEINHNEGLLVLSEQVKQFYKKKIKFRIYHGSTNSTRTQKFKRTEMVDISGFNRVLSINKKEKFAVVEPNVAMDRLVAETLKYSLVPPVVMEFPGITVGGGVSGGAGESSSFKYGGFHQTCLEYEVVLGNGEVVLASEKKNQKLFYGVACAYGTLGILTKIKIKLITAKPFVHLRYERVTSFQESVAALEKLVKTNVDFIDAILFSRNSGVIMSGVFSDSLGPHPSPLLRGEGKFHSGKEFKRKKHPITKFRRARDEWFYLHAEKICNYLSHPELFSGTSNAEKMPKQVRHDNFYEEFIPLEDYLFRYNRGGFWVGKYAFIKSHIPFNRFTRFLFDPFFHTRTLYRFLQSINISQKQIVQDFILPIETVLKFMEYVDRETGIYPLWLLPGNLHSKDDKLSPGFIKTRLGIDVGIWGKPQINLKSLPRRQAGKISNSKRKKANEILFDLNRDLEKVLTKLGGRKVLYAHSYFSKKEFWKIYDEKWYLALRKKYLAEEVFPDIYEKTFVKEQYEVNFWKGLWNVVRSPFRLAIKD